MSNVLRKTAIPLVVLLAAGGALAYLSYSNFEKNLAAPKAEVLGGPLKSEDIPTENLDQKMEEANMKAREISIVDFKEDSQYPGVGVTMSSLVGKRAPIKTGRSIDNRMLSATNPD